MEERIQKGEKKLGIAIVDLNFLKKINDTYGHEKGNLAIKKLCFIICHIFQHSPVFRIGGDANMYQQKKSMNYCECDSI